MLFKSKHDAIEYLKDTDIDVLTHIEQIILFTKGFDVNFTLENQQFEKMLIHREVARSTADAE